MEDSGFRVLRRLDGLQAGSMPVLEEPTEVLQGIDLGTVTIQIWVLS